MCISINGYVISTTIFSLLGTPVPVEDTRYQTIESCLRVSALRSETSANCFCFVFVSGFFSLKRKKV